MAFGSVNMDESLSSRDHGPGQACQEGTGMSFPTSGEMNMDESLSSHDHSPGQACQEGTVNMEKILSRFDPDQACQEETGMSFRTLGMGEKVSPIYLLFYHSMFDLAR